MNTKEEIRKDLFIKRQSLSIEENHISSNQIKDIFFEEFSSLPGEIIAGYWPVIGEADDKLILEKYLEFGKICCLPIMEEPYSPLVFKQWDLETKLEKAKYGVMEPRETEDLEPDIVLVPLVAFNEKGHRLGFGGGIYDRTLELHKSIKDIVTIGIAYDWQQVDELPIEGHDVPLDYVVTNKRVFDFKGRV